MNQIKLRDEYIKLGQALKASGLMDRIRCEFVIQEGKVKVNGLVETRRVETP